MINTEQQRSAGERELRSSNFHECEDTSRGLLESTPGSGGHAVQNRTDVGSQGGFRGCSDTAIDSDCGRIGGSQFAAVRPNRDEQEATWTRNGKRDDVVGTCGRNGHEAKRIVEDSRSESVGRRNGCAVFDVSGEQVKDVTEGIREWVGPLVVGAGLGSGERGHGL